MQLAFDFDTQQRTPYRTPFKNRKCEFEGCGRKHFSKGYCTKHVARLNKYGHPAIAGRKSAGSFAGICFVMTCGRMVSAKGLCNAHWLNLRRFGIIEPEPKRIKRTPGVDVCIVDDCTSPAGSRDLCSTHRSRLYRYGIADPPGIREKRYARIPDGATCELDGCESPVSARGMCHIHLSRKRRSEDPLTYKMYNQKRRVRVARGYVYDYAPEQIAARMAYFGHKCWMCGDPATALDHVKPVSKGGSDCPANFRPACKSCNSRKGARWYGVQNLSRFIKA